MHLEITVNIKPVYLQIHFSSYYHICIHCFSILFYCLLELDLNDFINVYSKLFKLNNNLLEISN